MEPQFGISLVVWAEFSGTEGLLGRKEETLLSSCSLGLWIQPEGLLVGLDGLSECCEANGTDLE